MRKVCLILWLLAGFAVGAFAQQVEVTANVPDEQVAVGKPFALDLTLKAPYGSLVEWNPFATDTLSAQIDILKRGELLRTADADSNIIMQQQLTLMTFDTGYVQVPPIGFTVTENGNPSTFHFPSSAFSNPVDLHVTTMAVDTTQAFHPIAAPIEHPVTIKEVYPWILAALLLIIVVIVVWYLVKHRKPKVIVNGKPVRGRVIPPYEKAISDLQILREQKLWQAGRVKEYYSGLSDIAREYIEGQFHVNAVEMTTDEILQEMDKLKFDKQIYDKLRDAMDLSDLVKFAKYTTSSLENDNAMDNMEGFVKESYLQFQATKTAQEGGGSAS